MGGGDAVTDVARLQAPQGERYVNYTTWLSDFRAGRAPCSPAAQSRGAADGQGVRQVCRPRRHLPLQTPPSRISSQAHCVVTRDDASGTRLGSTACFLFGSRSRCWCGGSPICRRVAPLFAIAVLLPLLTIYWSAARSRARAERDRRVAARPSAIWPRSARRAGPRVAAALMKPYAAVLAIGIVSVVDRPARQRQRHRADCSAGCAFRRREHPRGRARGYLQIWGLRSVGWRSTIRSPGRSRSLCMPCALASLLSWLCVCVRAGGPPARPCRSSCSPSARWRR